MIRITIFYIFVKKLKSIQLPTARWSFRLQSETVDLHIAICPAGSASI